jgi:hypothetical protein
MRIRAFQIEVPGVRAILPARLWAVLAVSAIGAARAQTVPEDMRTVARNRLDSLLHAYGPTLKMRFHRDADDPFQFEGVFDNNLHYAWRFELQINVTPQNTIGVRVYPMFSDRIDMTEVRDPNGLALRLLRLSAHNFLHWGVDDASHVFAAYTFTLESGFPEEAFKEVLRSIPLVDESVGEITQFIE